ncbi:quinolinate synthase NadA [Rhizobium leguminosarum]|uniref:quinolinate synthase NadA n=1 Tax=Rhizobium leguminosarum TaxID=384 RepID=UPI00102FCE34|nr:quinolinate synthase NadA [Rhizobium leguminosarum]TBF66331.1 hypothetical protein ELG84_31345 [Rhizobium leguminosarum]
MNYPVSASSLYERVSRVIPKAEWMTFENDVDAILELKRRRNAVILAHNYQTPEIFHGVADIVGDSLALARKAIEVDADVDGHCEVHELFTAEDVRQLRESHPGVTVLAHPECPPEVVAEADFAGSTAVMSDYVGRQKPARVVLLTECSMSDNVAVHHPDVEFIRPCNLCPHMKRITLANIRAALEENRHEVTVDPAIAVAARRAVERMLAI